MWTMHPLPLQCTLAFSSLQKLLNLFDHRTSSCFFVQMMIINIQCRWFSIGYNLKKHFKVYGINNYLIWLYMDVDYIGDLGQKTNISNSYNA